jgi:hypothetical protein
MLPREVGGERWRLVDNVADIKASGGSREATVVRILTLNREIVGILTDQVGLLYDFPPPPSFLEFIAHEERLRLCWDQSLTQYGDDRIPFPDAFDDDLEQHMKGIRKKLARLV